MSDKAQFPAWQCAKCNLWMVCSLSEHECKPSEKSAAATVPTDNLGMPFILTKETDLAVKELTVYDNEGVLPGEGTAEAVASVTLITALAKSTTPPMLKKPEYGAEFALYDSGGNILPADEVVGPGSYLLATSLGVKPGTPNIQNIQVPGKTKIVKSIVVEMTMAGLILQKTIYDDGSMDVATVKAPEIPASLLAEAPDVRERSLEPYGKGGWRRRPRAKTLFDTADMPRDKWCYMVECRRKMTVHALDELGNPVEDIVWADFHPMKPIPRGFGDEASALRRMIAQMREDRYNMGLGIVEYRVVPHYLGYKPDSEAWYAKTWHPPAADPAIIEGPLFDPPDSTK
jgi:hypothetical protein